MGTALRHLLLDLGANLGRDRLGKGVLVGEVVEEAPLGDPGGGDEFVDREVMPRFEDPEQLRTAERRARELGKPGATSVVADVLEELLAEGRPLVERAESAYLALQEQLSTLHENAATTGPAVDGEAIRTVLAHIRSELQQGEMSVQDRVRQEANLLKQAFGVHHAQFESLVSSFDFEAALDYLDRYGPKTP